MSAPLTARYTTPPMKITMHTARIQIAHLALAGGFFAFSSTIVPLLIHVFATTLHKSFGLFIACLHLLTATISRNGLIEILEKSPASSQISKEKPTVLDE